MARLFQQWTQGYGPTPVIIEVKLDGLTIFNGAVPTLNEYPKSYWQGEASYTWEEPDDVSGTKQLRVECISGKVFQFATTHAQMHPGGNIGLAGWLVYSETISTPGGNIVYTDPLSNVTINGQDVSYLRPPPQDDPNQWGWQFYAGDVLEATLTINTPFTPAP